MLTIYDLLTGNDLRSIGKSNEVVQLVTSDPELFDEIFKGIFHNDKIIRARCADAVEKVARVFPNYILKRKKIILKNLQGFNQKEVIWHIVMMLGFIKFTPKEKDIVVNQLFKWLNTSESIIVKVACLQTLADHAAKDRILRKIVLDEIKKQMVNGAPAVKARGRMLIKTLSEKK